MKRRLQKDNNLSPDVEGLKLTLQPEHCFMCDKCSGLAKLPIMPLDVIFRVGILVHVHQRKKHD